MSGTRALILDFGGVISRTLFETHDITEKALGLRPGTLTWRGPFDPSTDELWASMQNREITERDYWMFRTQEVSKIAGENWKSMQEFVQAARGADAASVIRPEAEAAIKIVKENGVKLAVLSNELDLFYGPQFRKDLVLLSLFDVIVDATYTKILKPDPRAYQLCLDELALPASACIFVDDQKKNVDGALAIGLPTVHFDVTHPRQSYVQALADLGLTLPENLHA